MNLIKEKTRALHLTQQAVARELNVSLPTVKRWWVGRGVNLSNLQSLCSLLGLSLSQLFLELEGGSANYAYSVEQERMLANNPKALAVFDLLVSGETPKSIQRKYSMVESELVSILLKLDRVGLIELHDGNRVKLIRNGEPQWIVGGLLSQKYRHRMIDSLLGEHAKTEVSFYIHDYLPEDVVLLKGKFKEIENLMKACNVRGSMQKDNATSHGAYFCFKPFEWDIHEALRKGQ